MICVPVLDLPSLPAGLIEYWARMNFLPSIHSYVVVAWASPLPLSQRPMSQARSCSVGGATSSSHSLTSAKRQRPFSRTWSVE
jgi:hypothetical protein